MDGLGGEATDIPDRQTETIESRIDVQSSRSFLATCPAKRRPGDDIVESRENGLHCEPRKSSGGISNKAIKRVDVGLRRHPSRRFGLVGRGDEKGRATGSCERCDNALRAKTVGIGFDDG